MNPQRSDRRSLLKAAASTSLVGLLPACATGPAGERRADLAELDASTAIAGMKAGSFSAEAYAQTLLDRATKYRNLNAFIALDPQRVMEAARAADLKRRSGDPLGSLHGLPVVIKDAVNVSGFATTAGTGGLRDYRPKATAPVVQAMQSQGAIIMGKANLHELSTGWTNNNPVFGPARNPYDIDRVPGGSSGGTAVAIAARICSAGIAEDTNGSIRVPAALCGVCGLRPSTGRYSTQGTVPLAPSLDTLGPMARSVSDLALLDSVVTGSSDTLAQAALKGMRIGIPRSFYEGLDSEVESSVNEALRRLRSDGAVLVEADLPDAFKLTAGITVNLIYYEMPRSVSKFLREEDIHLTIEQLLEKASPDIQKAYAAIIGDPRNLRPIPEDAYLNAKNKLQPALRVLYREYFGQNRVAAILHPPVMALAPRISSTYVSPGPDVEVNGKLTPGRTVFSRNIAPSSAAGLPSVVLPAGLSRSGLPVSLELDGPAGADRRLLGVAMAIEKSLGQLPAPKI